MNRILAYGVCLIACTMSATQSRAHDLKVFASRPMIPEVGPETTIYLSAGHRTPVDDLIPPDTIARYDWISPDGAVQSLGKSDLGIHAHRVRPTAPGIHTIVASKNPSIYTYVMEGGARRLKPKSKQEHKGSVVDFGARYEDFGKTFVVVGDRSPTAPKPVGLAVEIVPLQGPALWRSGRDLKFQVLRNGRPVPIATVLARYVGYKPDDAWGYATESNRNGEFTIRPSQAGTWIIGIEFRELTQGEVREQYDFEVYSTTLTFEVDA